MNLEGCQNTEDVTLFLGRSGGKKLKPGIESEKKDFQARPCHSTAGSLMAEVLCALLKHMLAHALAGLEATTPHVELTQG